MNSSSEPSVPDAIPAAKAPFTGPFTPTSESEAITTVPPATPTAAKGNDEVMSQQPGR